MRGRQRVVSDDPTYADLTEKVRRLEETADKYRVVEALLKQTKDFNVRILKNLKDIYYRTEVTGRITMVSDFVTVVTGYAPADLIGTRLTDRFIGGENRDRYASLLQDTGGVTDFETRIRIRGGEWKWLSINAGRIYDDAGEFIGVEGVARDVTLRKSLEESLYTYEFIANTSKEFMTLIDRDYVYRAVNDSYCRALGKSRDEIVGKSVWVLWGEEVFERVIKDYLDRCFRGKEVQYEARLRFFGRDPRWFEINYYPYLDSEKTVSHAVVVSRDVDMAKRAERVLLKAHDELDYRVRQRTRSLELANAQLKREVAARKQTETELEKARDAAADASSAKSEFLANISHEIRTPVSGIVGMIRMTLSTLLTKDQRENLFTIKGLAESILSLTNDILDLSKIEARKLTFYPENVSLPRRIPEIVRPFTWQAREKGVELAWEIDPDLPDRLYVDIHRLSQVLRNLLSNAVKFTERGKIVLHVFQTGQDETGVELAFSVSDTGVGIPEEKISHLFQSFSRVDSPDRRRREGTGLGLAVSKRIVDLMGGRMTVESRIEEGSVFTVTVRLARARPDDAPVTDAAPHLEASGPGDPPPLNILLAEDNAVNVKYITHFLRKAGHKVTSVTDGRGVLPALRERDYDVVLMDVQLPGMDGIETTRRIRSETGGGFDPNIPVIGLTAYALKGDRERLLSAGMNEHVPKPVDFGRLHAVLRRFFAKTPKDGGGSPEKGRSPAPVLQWETALERMEGNESLLIELCRMFTEEASSIMESVERSLHSKKWEAAYQPVHSLKGTLSVLEAVPARQSAVHLEESLQNHDTEAAAARFQHLKDELRALTAYLSRYIRSS